jgi:hypothetical protein
LFTKQWRALSSSERLANRLLCASSPWLLPFSSFLLIWSAQRRNFHLSVYSNSCSWTFIWGIGLLEPCRSPTASRRPASRSSAPRSFTKDRLDIWPWAVFNFGIWPFLFWSTSHEFRGIRIVERACSRNSF